MRPTHRLHAERILRSRRNLSYTFSRACKNSSQFLLKVTSVMVSRNFSKSLIALLLIWLSALGSGFVVLGAYHARPGHPGTPPVHWPEGSPIRLDPVKPTLLIFLHPRCPCSRASVAELAALAARAPERCAVHATVARPHG